MTEPIFETRDGNVVCDGRLEELKSNGKVYYLDTDIFGHWARFSDTVKACLMKVDTERIVFYQNLADCPTGYPTTCPNGKTLEERTHEDCSVCKHRKFAPLCPLGKKPICGLLYRPKDSDPVFFYHNGK